MSITPERLIDLSPQAKRELLVQLLGKKENQRTPRSRPLEPELPQIIPEPQHRYEPFPLTDIQQAYWLGRSSAFELGGVGIHGYFELDCIDLDIKRLNDAWHRTVERHDMMRAVILPEGVQCIQETVPEYRFETLDLRGKPPDVVAAQLESIRRRMSHNVFDPERWPLFEIRASKLDDHLTRLHFSEDALHADMLSTAIILDDWLRLYRNPELNLPAPELSFRDYALALERLKESDVYQRSLAYWRKRIETLPAGPELPRTKPLSTPAHTRFKRRSLTLDSETWSRLKGRAANAGITSSSVLMAIYAEVLGSWSSNTRFCINVTIYNRLGLHPEVEQIAGDFTSMIFLEVDRTNASTFSERARKLQKQLWTDLAFGHVSGVEVLRELARYRRQPPEPMFPVVFTGSLGTPGYRSLTKLGKPAYSVTQTPQVTLDQQVFEEDGEMVLSWDAVEELFPAGVLDQMFDAYSALLTQLANDEDSWQSTNLIPVAHPDQRLLSHPQLMPERKTSLSTLFSEQASRRPHQAAVITGGLTLSYLDLERQSNRLAGRLERYGVGRGTLVGVVMEKGWEQFAGVLAILKAGAAYVPIDPQLPQSRRFELIANAEVEIVLTQAHLVEEMKWPEEIQVETLKWEDDGEEQIETSTENGWDELAYVMYTSGSTGVPKGVMIDHGNIINRMVDVVERFGITAEDTALALTALHHDLSVFDLFGMLAVAGGTVVIPDARLLLDPSHWLELIRREQISIWNSVPAFMQMLVEYHEGASLSVTDSPSSLRLVLLSGDWIPIDLPDRVRALSENVQIISLGGPTETTVWDICYPIGEIDPGWTSIPYGRPMANTRYYVLKDNLEVCPTWVTGELCIAGTGLSRGYWRDPEKTENSFITNAQTGERLYRSGDLGRYLPDGNIEILGRKDFQIKIRGQRIELGEIESVLKQHPQVDAALVTVVETQGLKQLVAYVVLRGEAVPVSNALNQTRSSDVVETSCHSKNESGDAWSRLDFQLEQPALRRDPDRWHFDLIKPQRTEEFLETHTRRRSQRKFLTKPLSLPQFSEFLSCLMQLEQEDSVWPKYRYPSAANLYPVQIYLYVKPGRVEEVPAGIYYYHPVEHALVMLSPDAFIDKSVHGAPNQEIFEESAFSIFLVGELNAVTPLYPEQARDFCLLEAGYAAQLLMTVAPDQQIGLCPIGGLDFEQIRSCFALGDSHLFLHSLCGGLPLQPGDKHDDVSEGLTVPVSRDLQLRASAESDVVTAELRNFLRAKIPEYMVPQNIVLLDHLPLTSNGKIDHQALPLAQTAGTRGSDGHVPPKSDLERLIADVWQEVLNVDSLSVNCNFFELGATSIHMIQVRSKLQKLIGKDLPIADLFRHSTINSLARFIGSQQDDGQLLDESSSRAQIRKSLQLRGSVKE